MLIPNLAYQLFNYVFERYNTFCAAKFVNNNGHMQFLLLQKLKQIRYFHRRRNKLRRLEHSGNVPFGSGQTAEKVLFVNHPDNAINGLVIYRQTGIASLPKHLGNFFFRFFRHGFHIHSRRHNLDGLDIIKLNDIPEHITLTLSYAPLLFRLFYNGEKLTVGNRMVRAGAQQLTQALL